MKMMKYLLAFIILTAGYVYPQLKVGYVDSDTIMELLPDAQDANARLDALIQQWQDELSKMQQEWQTKYDDYEKRKLIMSDQRRAELESELIQLEQNIIKYREEKFGTNGELFKKEEELMKPVQNKVFTAIEEIAEEEDFDYVLDRSGGVLVLYAKEEYDITNLVLEKLKIEKVEN